MTTEVATKNARAKIVAAPCCRSHANDQAFALEDIGRLINRKA